MKTLSALLAATLILAFSSSFAAQSISTVAMSQYSEANCHPKYNFDMVSVTSEQYRGPKGRGFGVRGG